MTEPRHLSQCREAIAPLKRCLCAIALVAALCAPGGGYIAGASIGELCVALAVPLLLLATQWYAVTRATRPGAYGPAWILGAYPIRILLLACGLYVPKYFGLDVRVAAIVAIVTILLSMLAEVTVLAKACILTVSVASPAKE